MKVGIFLNFARRWANRFTTLDTFILFKPKTNEKTNPYKRCTKDR
jgi:hypothetical protein